MKVSFLIQNLGVRGSVRRVIELSNALVKRGYEATIYHGEGGKCEWLPMFARGRAIEDFAKDEHEIVIFFGHPHYDMVRACQARARIYYVLGLDPNVPGIRETLVSPNIQDKPTRNVRDILLDPSYYLIANCTALCNFIQEVSGRECSPVLGGVNFGTFHPGAQRQPNVIVAGGAKREIEGTNDILMIVDMLRQNNNEIKIEFYAGRGLLQDELARLISSASLFIDAQWYGGWNNPVAEAFACGVPVVCTDIFGNQDFVRHGENAWMIEPRNVNGMYKAALQLLENRELADKFAAAALDTIKSYTWEKAADQLEAVIGKALAI